jgi:hypothetical protein
VRRYRRPLTSGGNIIETGTDSYRLAQTRAPASTDPVGFHSSATSLDLGLLGGPLILVDEAAEDRAAADPLPVVVGRVLVQDCPQMRAGRRTARIECRQVVGDLIREYRRAA